METRPISTEPLSLVKSGVDKLAPTNATMNPSEFAGVVTRLLDEFDAADFRSAERILEAMRRQGRTVSGYPRVRPGDCDRVVRAIRAAFEANRPMFITGDGAIVQRFEQILDAFAKTDVRFYPRELMQARTLQAEARLLLKDPEGVRELIGAYADRIYKVEGDREDITRLMRLDCQARAARGDVEDLGPIAIGRARSLARFWPYSVRAIASDFVQFISFHRSARLRDGLLNWALVQTARVTARARIPGGSLPRRVVRASVAHVALFLAATCLFLLRWGDIRFTRRDPGDGKTSRRDIIVTRAMGGIGDLLIMTAGLRALSERRRVRIKLVVDRKFFDLFRNNPHVELVDIDGPPVDVTRCRAWFNLTRCPAGKYEAERRPFVKKGRTELFAKSMGVGKLSLYRYGWAVEYHLDAAQIAFRDKFIRDAGLGTRPLIGVQPYARDTYKDHPDIGRFIEALRSDYDLIIFHHVETHLSAGPGVASTGGLSLAQSIALVSALRALVCVDSGFLHAASAFDVPVIAMFGPTDGKLFTRHHRRATVISANKSFACAPCWRNEDLPCQLTGQFGPSPCVTALKVETVLAAVKAAMR